MSETFLYFIIKSICLICCGILLVLQEGEAGSLMIGLLAFCCLFLLELLIGMIKQGKYKKGIWMCLAVQSAACFLFGIDLLFPLTILLAWEWIEVLGRGQMFYQLGTVSTLLLGFLYTPAPEYMVLVIGNGGLFLLIRELNRTCIRYKELVFEQKERLAAAEKKVEDMRTYTKTIRD